MTKEPIIQLLGVYIETYSNDIHALKTLEFLNHTTDFWSRKNIEGHITASTWVVNPEFSKALMTHHISIGKWLQMGGHIEFEDKSLEDACRRELREESGIERFELFSSQLFDVDVHVISSTDKAKQEHLHYDLRMFCIIDEKEPIKFDPLESKEVKWIDLETLYQETPILSIRRMIEKTKINKDVI